MTVGRRVNDACHRYRRRMLSESENATAETVPWTPLVAFALWVLAFASSAVWVGVLSGLAGGFDELQGKVWLLFVGQLALWAVYGIGPLVLARSAEAHDPSTSVADVLKLHFDPVQVAVGAVLGVLIQFVVIPLVYLPLQGLLDEDEVGEVAENLIETAGTPLDIALLFVMIVIMAPIVEELFFRGVVLPSLVGWIGMVPGVLLSSLWFAGSHLQGLQFPGLLAVGLALGVIRVKTKSLLPAISMHMAFNGITFGVLVSQLELG